MLGKRLTVFLCPLLIFISLELIFINLKHIYYLLAAITLFLIFIFKYLIKERFFSRDFWYLVILPLLLFYATVAFLLLLNSDFSKHVIIALFSLILGVYLENIFLFFYYPLKYIPNSQENLAVFISLLIFFLLAIDLNSFNIFLNLPLWLLSLILILVVSILILQAFWSNKIKTELRFIYLMVINIIILEVFWALTFLPANFYISSIILTILFYLIWGVFKAQLIQQLEKKLIRRYLIITLILLILVIFTSNWS
jgi:hypothetical protein